jgi:signal transduction histidine kinase
MPDAADRRQDVRAFRIVVTILGATMALGATVQGAAVVGSAGTWFQGDTALGWLLRAAVNLATVVVILLAVAVARVLDQRPVLWPAWIVLISILAAAGRAALELAVGLGDLDPAGPMISDAILTALVCVIVLISGFGTVLLQRRARETERRHLRQIAQATEALALVQQDELRVRRQIADGLHGSVQNRLVLIGATLEAIAARLPEPERAEIELVRESLDGLREHEVRVLSAAVFPDAFDRGAIAAIRAMLARVPATIAVDVLVDGRADEVEGPSRLLSEEDRLHLVRAAEEALTNSLRHGRATRLSVAITADDDRILLRFDDDGRGLDPAATFSGIARLQTRFARAGGGLELSDGTAGGVSLRAWLPIPPAP